MDWHTMIKMRRMKELTHLNPFKSIPSGTEFKYCGSLSRLEDMAIDFRFFSNLPIARVADKMGMSWGCADALLDHAVLKILKIFEQYSTQIHDYTKGVFYEL